MNQFVIQEIEDIFLHRTSWWQTSTRYSNFRHIQTNKNGWSSTAPPNFPKQPSGKIRQTNILRSGPAKQPSNPLHQLSQCQRQPHKWSHHQLFIALQTLVWSKTHRIANGDKKASLEAAQLGESKRGGAGQGLAAARQFGAEQFGKFVTFHFETQTAQTTVLYEYSHMQGTPRAVDLCFFATRPDTLFVLVFLPENALHEPDRDD